MSSLAFLRFSNLYGTPTYLYSDNALTFIAGGGYLESSLADSEFVAHMETNNIKHVRIPLYSAWVGATWERLIRVLKSCLYKTIGRSKMTYFDLLTVLSDVQYAVNSRPLSYTSSDNELEIITPAHFVRPHVNQALVLNQDESASAWLDDVDRGDLVSSLALREESFNAFRGLWYDQYLLGLREQTRQIYGKDWVDTIKAGDVVLVRMPNKPRPWWLLGQVVEVIVGFDDRIRSVRLKRSDGVISHHSISHLYPLEISSVVPPRAVDLVVPKNRGIVQGEEEGSSFPPNDSADPEVSLIEDWLLRVSGVGGEGACRSRERLFAGCR